MDEENSSADPDWETPVTFTLTPEDIVHTVFWTAHSVHTGWESCIDASLTVRDTTAVDDDSGSHCRLAELEYVEDDEERGDGNEVTWHDWTVEIKVQDLYVSAHWRATDASAASDWDWCAAEAEQAFANACMLLGKRVRRQWVIEDSPRARRTPRTRH